MTSEMKAKIQAQTAKRFVLHNASGRVLATANDQFEGAKLQRLMGLLLSDMKHA